MDTAVTNWYNLVRAAVPNAVIAIIGQTSKVSPSAETLIESYVRQKVATLRATDPKLFFVAASGDPAGAWIVGTGSVAAPAGNGNADQLIGPDGLHPVYRGQRYIGEKAGDGLAAVLTA